MGGAQSTATLPAFKMREKQIINGIKQGESSKLSEVNIKQAMKTLLEKKFIPIRSLGKGSFGVVILATDTNGKQTAVKIMSIRDAPQIRNYEKEAGFYEMIKSKRVVEYYSQFISADKKYFFLCMEYCPKGNLENHWINNPNPTKDKIKKLFTQLLEGIIDLHSANLIHSNLKPENVLLTQNEEVKICDLGISKILNEGKTKTTLSGQTPFFASPEQRNDQVGKESDYYSAGFILYKTCNPECTYFDILSAMQKGGPKDSNHKFADLMRIAISMMQFEPKERSKPIDVIKFFNPNYASPQLQIPPPPQPLPQQPYSQPQAQNQVQQGPLPVLEIQQSSNKELKINLTC